LSLVSVDTTMSSSRAVAASAAYGRAIRTGEASGVCFL
jgi:hypothetical protein